MFKPVGHLVISFAVGVLLGGMVLTTHAVGATTKPSPSMSSSSISNTEASVKEKKGQIRISSEERIEKRIKKLHDKLEITDAQEKEWNNVAATMRDNEMLLHGLIMERQKKGSARTAIDDLVSYQKIATVHAESLGKFITVFQPIYQAMSDKQKKNADFVFGRFEGRGHDHKAENSKSKSK